MKRERKVHYYGENGEVTRTLCFTGSNVPRSTAWALKVTNDPGAVTCKICEFRLFVDSEIARLSALAEKMTSESQGQTAGEEK
jgi:hypothetical protein